MGKVWAFLTFISSKYTTLFRKSKSTHPSCSMAIKKIKDGYSHITTGVTTWRSGVPSLFRVKIETTWSATQVCRRRVKAGLGGHEEGVDGVDEGVEKTSLPL